MTVTTEEAERLAQRLETKSWRPGFPNDFYPEPSGGVFINGVFCGNTATALRSLAAERDALQARVAELRRLVQCLIDVDPEDMAADGVTVLDVWRKEARAALEGEKA
jgi:hypothetical protein